MSSPRSWFYQIRPLSFWFLALGFFAFQFILRLWPGIMMPDIMRQFHIDATAFGMLASVYYYGYAGFQIPIAMALDYFGTRLVLGLSALVAAAAVLLFQSTDQWGLALLSRFLIGASSAVGFLGVSKVIADWFPQSAYARMVGLSFSFALLGAVYGGKPVTLLLEELGTDQVVQILAIIATVLGLLVLIFLRQPLSSEKNIRETEPAQFLLNKANLKHLLTSPTLWVLAIANLLMVGTLEGFADVWGVQYLILAHGLSKPSAAGMVSFIFVGMLFGGPLLAWLSQQYGEYMLIAFCGLIMCLIFILLVFLPFSTVLFSSLFFSLGLCCCYQVLIFSAGSREVPKHLFGLSIALLNCLNMLGGSFFHTVIGYIMDQQRSGLVSGAAGVQQYDLASYYHSLSIIPISAVLGGMMVAFLAIKYKSGPSLHATLNH